MTSERMDRANRQNAQTSTGPRTGLGKARSSQNARTHGLSAAHGFLRDGEEADRLVAVLLNGAGRDPGLRDAARAVAEAHIHLKHVLSYKRSMSQGAAFNSLGERGDEGASYAADVTPELLKALDGLERYERRAFSRRRSATRRFLEIADRNNSTLLDSAPKLSRYS